jgi:phage tail sheath protein FI
MGARTLKQSGSTADKYVAMRRSLNYLRKRITDLTQFAVFENNNETLWAQVRTVLGVFLNEYRNQGGLRGATPAAAYFIKCDAENNTPVDIANGIVNIEVGVALEYPAEFVVITLAQKTIN